MVAGGLDPHRPSDDPDHPPPRDLAPAAVQRVARQRYDMATAREPGAAGGPGILHVPGQHQPDDQPSGLPAGRR